MITSTVLSSQEVSLKKKIKAIDADVSFNEVFNGVKQIKAVKISSGKEEIIFRTELPDKAYLAFKAIGGCPAKDIVLR